MVQTITYLENPTMNVPTTPPLPRKLIPHEFFANQKHEKLTHEIYYAYGSM